MAGLHGRLVNKYIVRITIALSAGLLAAAVGFLMVVFSPHESTTAGFVVAPNSTARSVARNLERDGVIKSWVVFLALARLTGKAEMIKAGEYDFAGRYNQWQILRLMAEGRVKNFIVVIPEGYTVRQIADVLTRRKIADGDRFRRLALQNGRLLGHSEASLEGFLFPDTYRLPRGISEEDVARVMMSRFHQVTEPVLGKDDSSGHNFSIYELITVASMVEREARLASERPVIASVIFNRLSGGMKLEIDATVQYALPAHKSRLLYSDLKVDSPYNTYLYPGLPPGPISNPGLGSIKAAASPAKTDYFFYVARPDGSHIFSRTYREHLRAIDMIKRGESS